MKALRQLGFLKLSLRPERAPAGEDHRVLELFRNRAELKKAYGGLQDESFRLKDLIKQQEGATQRVQEMLSTLEGRLGNARDRLRCAGVLSAARPVAVRARAAHAVRRRPGAPAGRARAARAPGAAQPPAVRPPPARRKQLAAAQASHQEAAAQVAQLEAERARLTRFWHYFKRRALERLMHATQAQLNEAQPTLGQAQADPRGTGPRGSAGVSGVVPGGTPLHQSRGDRLRRGAVPARGDPEDPARANSHARRPRSAKPATLTARPRNACC